MTHDDYIQFLKKSPLFQGLEEDVQKKLLQADAKDMESNVQMFQNAHKAMGGARDQLVEENKSTMNGFKQNVRNIKREKRKKDEAMSDKEEAMRSEELLRELNKI